MKTMQKIFSVLLATMVIVSLLGCNRSSGGARPVSLSLNHVGSTSHFYHHGSVKFAELVAEYTNGAITVDVFPASQIASGARAIEFVQLGTLDIALESTMALENFVPEAGVLNLPFLFKSEQDAFRILSGEVGAELERAAEARGLKIIGWWNNGFRNISNSMRAIRNPEDLRGMKIRVPESRVFIETFQALGAIPTAMAVSEVFSAMQLGTVDGQENPSANFVTMRFLEINKFYTESGHIFTAEPLVMNLERFNSFSSEQQAAIIQAGVQIDQLGDINDWINAVAPVYALFPQFDSLRQRIQAAQ